MAIDTASKRYSMINFGGIPDILLPEPDNAISQEDRQQLLELYGGVLTAVVAPTTRRSGYVTHTMMT